MNIFTVRFCIEMYFFHNFSLLISFFMEHGNFSILLSVANETRSHVVRLQTGMQLSGTHV